MKLLFKILLISGGLLLFLTIFPRYAFSDTITTSATVSNSAPTISATSVDNAASSITLTEAVTKKVFCNATITDTNGNADITGANATFFTQTSSIAATNKSKHYKNSSCRLVNAAGDTKDAICTFFVEYYSISGNWRCNLTGKDASNAQGFGQDNITMNTLTALNLNVSSIAYGTLNLAQKSSNRTVLVNNTGNSQIDLAVGGYGSSQNDGFAMTCTSGNINVGFEKFNTTGTALTPKINLTNNVTLAAFDLRTRVGSPSTKNTFWELTIPGSGVSGSCTGNILFVAVSG